MSTLWRQIGHRPTHNRGFTLVEVMIALVLMSLAMTLMMAGLRYSAKAWNSADQRMMSLADLQAARRLVGSTLSRAIPVVIGEEDDKRYLFEGEEHAVTFAVYMPPYPDQAGLYLTTLFITEEDAFFQLRLKRSLLTPDINPFGQWQPEEDVLIWQSEQPLSFAYFGTDSDEEGSWQTQWDGAMQIPQLVKLEIDSATDEQRPWPNLITPIRVDMDSHCITRSERGLCRLPL